jgi:hypothetical protein
LLSNKHEWLYNNYGFGNIDGRGIAIVPPAIVINIIPFLVTTWDYSAPQDLPPSFHSLLTRRLPEALATIEPAITAPSFRARNEETESAELAPVATASRSTRIKIWNLYLTILNAIIELGPEDGKNAIGSKEWRSIVSKVRDGTVWEDIVRDGYGVEGDVDSDVVINL